MANIVASVLGGNPKRMDVDTVGEAKEELNLTNYTASVNGEPADDDTELTDEDFVSFAPSVKGG